MGITKLISEGEGIYICQCSCKRFDEANDSDLVEEFSKIRQRGTVEDYIDFESGDWVWVQLRKERFYILRKTKLDARGDGPFQVLKRINDNAYKIDLHGEQNDSATFNVSDLSLFDMDVDSRKNPNRIRGR